jgi:hypothetical protein
MICPRSPPRTTLLGAGVDKNQARASVTSKSRSVTILSGMSFGEFDHYVEYVPRPVPRTPRTTSKRAWADDTSTSASTTKKPHHPSTHPGTQVTGSMLLGECINILRLPW